MTLSQRVVGEFDGQKRSFRIEVEVTPTHLTMVALTPFGVPLFSLMQSSEQIKVDTFSREPLPFDPRYILSDFQLAHWPVPILKPKLISVGLYLKEENWGRLRKLLGKRNKVLAEIHFVRHTRDRVDIVIEHFDFPYRLQIETLKSYQASRLEL